VVVTISRGRVVWENGRLDARPGTSRYVHLPTGGPLFEGLGKRDAARYRTPYGAAPVPRGAAAGGGGSGGGGGGGGGDGGGDGGGEGAEPLVAEAGAREGKEEL
jgi:hypothetical protein